MWQLLDDFIFNFELKSQMSTGGKIEKSRERGKRSREMKEKKERTKKKERDEREKRKRERDERKKERGREEKWSGLIRFEGKIRTFFEFRTRFFLVI